IDWVTCRIRRAVWRWCYLSSDVQQCAHQEDPVREISELSEIRLAPIMGPVPFFAFFAFFAVMPPASVQLVHPWSARIRGRQVLVDPVVPTPPQCARLPDACPVPCLCRCG